MYRSIGLSIILAVIAVVTSMPTNADPVIILDFNSGFDDSPLQDTSVTQELFSTSKLIAVPTDQVEGRLRYRIGKRIKNDRVVSQNTDAFHWATPQNVTFILQYPTTGKGAIVTCIEIDVNQSSNKGLARVIAGGIGQRFVAAIVESNSTYWFNYSSRIYGI